MNQLWQKTTTQVDLILIGIPKGEWLQSSLAQINNYTNIIIIEGTSTAEGVNYEYPYQIILGLASHEATREDWTR